MSKLILEKSTNQLPKGWSYCLLDDIALEINSGFASGKHNKAKKGVPHLRPMNIDANGKINLDNVKYVQVDSYDSLKKGDVLFNNTNSEKWLGKTALIDQDSNWAYSNHMTRIRFDSQLIEPGWISTYLHKLLLDGYYSLKCTHHVNQASINSTYLSKKIPIKIAPLNEQRRIVEKVEELFSKIDNFTESINRVKLQLKQYRLSLLTAVVASNIFGDEVKYPKKPLSEIIDSIGQGWSPRCEISASLNEEEWAVIKTSAIQPMKFNDEQNKKLPATLEPRSQLEIKEGDILITRAGPRSRVGITCLVRKTRKRLMLCDKAYRIQYKKNLVDPAFLEIVLNAPDIVKHINTMKTGISDSGVNITQGRFSKILVPFPSLNDQKKIVKTLENIFSQIVQQEIAIEYSSKQSAALRNSILKTVFAGELVPQDPNDEPAEVLLEKIKKEKVIKTTIQKPRRKKNVK